MAKILTKIRRYRFSEEQDFALKSLLKYGVNESSFVREAIMEKVARDVPKLENELKRKRELIECPF